MMPSVRLGPGFHLLGRGLAMAVIAASIVVAIQTYGFDWTRSDGDAWNYLAAGERLNAGHDLYALGPDDRRVVIVPPYWTVPLLAPPPIAVAWRPLAILGEPSMVLWGLAGAASTIAAAAFVATRGGLWLIAVFALPISLTVLSGNASVFVLPLLLGAWAFRDRPWTAGAAVAIATAIKLTPAALLVWLVVTRRWRAAGVTVLVTGAIALIGALGAGLDAYVDWAESAVTAAPSPLAIGTWLGVPPTVAAAALVVPVVLLARADRVSCAAAITAAALATPALYFPGIALLAALPVTRRLWESARQPERAR